MYSRFIARCLEMLVALHEKDEGLWGFVTSPAPTTLESPHDTNCKRNGYRGNIQATRKHPVFVP